MHWTDIQVMVWGGVCFLIGVVVGSLRLPRSRKRDCRLPSLSVMRKRSRGVGYAH